MQNKLTQAPLLCGADFGSKESYSVSSIVSNGYIPPTYIQFGNVKIHCKTGEVTGLSENISEDAKLFWKEVKEQVIGKWMVRHCLY